MGRNTYIPARGFGIIRRAMVKSKHAYVDSNQCRFWLRVAVAYSFCAPSQPILRINVTHYDISPVTSDCNSMQAPRCVCNNTVS